ncbi:preprotein translocase subunit SecA [Campylobacter jejuni]|uniref:Protein translocase subunit SecA n=1 Tax=Campylobacter jejuni TaxID=197 RepID=A0A5T0D9B6_CAMJU|nr:preprotein translocase subunit SecA [Campylobacter jejuni]ADT66256.1 preprotein translocase, SecA subunit [Campylobacter jejuni subsp. jejuni ICDCCJ07001]ALF91986.1 preprotein translocase, SecA subunit [Campylobacter jejuni subsp. jejuni]ALF93622.1 preprotein translocase, SecA subunit [Campylobacter jejuni subsp. jejuni]ANS24041.1 preprotein translocase, SecA subunit [Campylobacter jejuni subsp. jejuni]AOW97257.1 preprotein translocase, SecA subunit [Campylobacter jejuni subsp. jejuni str. 
MFLNTLKAVFGTKNDREVKKYFKRVAQINALEGKYQNLSDDELKAEFAKFKEQILSGEKNENDILNDVFAIVRETGKRTLNMRHFDVQLIGGMVLHDGKIAEMKTGEGKTLVATLPVVLNAMSGKGVHVVTVNDYLAKRDAEQMSAIYNFLGFSVGVILSSQNSDIEHKQAYDCDITYGTNNEFGFDYLRDNMKFSKVEKVQREHNFVIVDEVDSILIDEARTPLIISGPTNRTLDGYIKANEVAKQMQKGEAVLPPVKPEGDFVVDEKNRNILITEAGIAKAEKLFGVENLYSLDNAILAHQLDQALKAHNLFEKDVHYVLRNNEVIIVDEFTGRLSEGRRFSEGLHQALEAKENVKIQEESQTLADITFQNYFRMYNKLAGMTGTAQTEATEFSQIYSLDVISIPTNIPIKRQDKDDLIYKSQNEKFKAVIEEIKKANAKGQPVLVGTASIERSEVFHNMLVKEKIPHHVLNAKNHEQEALIIQDAGKKGAVTIATNMAGRGVDIKIDDEIRALGGLYIIGTERHESRRIDNQLRGRAGRQGDPGISRFYLSLEDNLLRIFGGDRIKSIMDRLGIEEGESIESRIVTRAVENAQKKVESLHFESRKHLLEYDDVANEQRKTIYRYRNELLDENYDIRAKISQNIAEYSANVMNDYILDESGSNVNFENLKAKILYECSTQISEKDFENLSVIEMQDKLSQILENSYNEKMSRLEIKELRNIERILYLQVLDNAWREHLYQMDILKTGIGLRGYNQKDPLVEYKKESYNLFLELVNRIKFDSIKLLFSVQFNQEEVQNLENKANEENEKLLQSSVEMGASEDNLGEAEFKKVPRNAPCPCGSGKKFKECHGKSGPKQGILA